MESITKEIKGYLGTGLKMKSPNGFRPNGKESTGNPGEVYLTGDLYADIENKTFKGEIFKPMLYPLPMLTQEVSKEIDNASCNKLNLKSGFGNWYEVESEGKRIGVKALPFYAIEILQKYHYDVHGLIPKGLAIDKSKT